MRPRTGAWMVIVLTAAMAAESSAGAQTPLGRDSGGSKPAPRAATRVMDIQPVLDGIDLIDQNGKPVTLAQAVGTDGPVMVNFIFTTCPTICPVMSAGFSKLNSSLGSDQAQVRLVSISIDPEADTPAVLRDYAKKYRAGKSWLFLTGTPEASEAAQSAFGANRGDKMNHAPTTYIRRSRDGAWEQLDGLSGGETLLAAYRGDNQGHRQD